MAENIEEVESGEEGGFSLSLPEEDIADNEEQYEEEKVNDLPYVIKEGDVFVYDSGVMGLCVLGITNYTSVGRIFKVRLYSSVSDWVESSEDDLRNFIAKERLTKLTTYADQMEAVSEKMIMNQGDVYTRNGEVFIEILTNEMTYINSFGEYINVIGCRTDDGVVAYRDAIVVKSMVYGNSDQFPDNV